jgi:group I intron endonuclease
MKYFIYKTICTVSGKFYIGKRVSRLENDGYLGSGKVLRLSLAKYGRENHQREILEYCESKELLSIREREIVNEEMLRNPLCMNLKRGGDGGSDKGVRFSKQRDEKISSTMQQLYANGKHKREYRPLLEEHKIKISNANKGKSIGLGRSLSEEHKQSISLGSKGKPKSDEWKKKAAVAAKARWEKVRQSKMTGENNE